MAKDLYRDKRRAKGKVQLKTPSVNLTQDCLVPVPTSENKPVLKSTVTSAPVTVANNDKGQVRFSLLPPGQYFPRVIIEGMKANDPFWLLVKDIVDEANGEIKKPCSDSQC